MSMNFFDRPSRRSRIALGGSSSRPATAEELIAKAKKSREQRAHIRAQHEAARNIQRAFRARHVAQQLASPASSSSPLYQFPTPSSLPQQLIHFLLVAGIVNARSVSVSHHITSIKRCIVSRHHFLFPVAKQLAQSIVTRSTIDNINIHLEPVITVKAVTLLFASAVRLELTRRKTISPNTNSNNNSNSGGNIISLHEDSVLLIRAACMLLIHALSKSSLSSSSTPQNVLSLIVQWGVIAHFSDICRLVLSSQQQQQQQIKTKSKNDSQLWSSHIEPTILQLYESGVNYSPIHTQLAIGLLSIDQSVSQLDYKRRFDMFSAFVLALTTPVTSQQQEQKRDNVTFFWDFMYRVDVLKLPDIAMMLANILIIADYAWANHGNSIRWPLISVVSTLVHALPKGVWQLTMEDDDFEDEDDDDDDGDEAVEVIGDGDGVDDENSNANNNEDVVNSSEQNVDNDEASASSTQQQNVTPTANNNSNNNTNKNISNDVDDDGDTKMYNNFVNSNRNDIPSSSSSSIIINNNDNRQSSSTSYDNYDDNLSSTVKNSTLRVLMNHVSSSLERMVSEESVRNIFAAAVSEGHGAILCVCDLFNFLTRRDRKLTVPLRDALALWRSSSKHILTVLWRECTMAVESGVCVLRPDTAPILSIFSATYSYLLYFQDVDEMFDSQWPFPPDMVRDIASVLKSQLFTTLYIRNSRLANSTNVNPAEVTNQISVTPTATTTTTTTAAAATTNSSPLTSRSQSPETESTTGVNSSSSSLTSSSSISQQLQQQPSSSSSHSSPYYYSSKTTATTAQNAMAHVLRTEPGLLDEMTRLLSRLHAVDSQRRFTTGDTFWEAGHGALSSDTFVKYAVEAGPDVLMRGRDELETTSVGAVRQVRYRTTRQQAVNGAGELLRVAPYVVPFTTRSKIFQSWVAAERDRVMLAQQQEHMAISGLGDISLPMMMPERVVSVRRKHIYEDAFRELNNSHDENGGHNLRAIIRVKFIDEHGLEEAGIDGGGVFKEFMHEVLRMGFSPFSYGLFKSTPDGHIYPNPDAHVAVRDALTQFKFLGKLLGKAVFDGVLVDIPLAKFFRLKMLGEVNYPTDLMSMDPQMYKSLKILRSAPPDTVEDFGLTFTVVNDGFGAAREVELKPNGRNINVTAANRIEYIHRFARYRMNVQIKEESEAFLKGFYEVVPSQLIRLFSHDELQLLISGKGGKIDLDDWRRNTKYSGGYSEETPVIQWFWTAVAQLSPDDQAKMLQFVTSSPRAPLLGFAYLVPGFCIHRAEGNVRLPTASTCMNLLKLPEYPSLKVVKEKLTYALHSNAGFDLS